MPPVAENSSCTAIKLEPSTYNRVSILLSLCDSHHCFESLVLANMQTRADVPNHLQAHLHQLNRCIYLSEAETRGRARCKLHREL
jgi:hypothetical protein